MSVNCWILTVCGFSQDPFAFASQAATMQFPQQPGASDKKPKKKRKKDELLGPGQNPALVKDVVKKKKVKAKDGAGAVMFYHQQ